MYRVAEKGVFTLPKTDPIESVKRTSVLKVFTYLSWTNSVQDCENHYNEIMSEKRINENHDNIYPLCLVKPPSSKMESIYEGWEDYSYEVYFVELWKKENRDASTMSLHWDNTQRIANEWLDNVLNTYDNEDLILDPESLEIERIQEFTNDRLIAIKYSFTLQAFRTCFNPKEFYVDSYYDNNEKEVCVQHEEGAPLTCSDFVLISLSCRCWIRSDGWKDITIDDTLYNIVQFTDMSSFNGFIHPGIPPLDTSAHNFPVWDAGGTTTNRKALLESNVSQANNIHYADTLTNLSDANPLTPRKCQYMNGDGVSGTDPSQNQFAILNGYDWTIALVFTLDTIIGDTGMRYFSTFGADAIANTNSQSFDIYNKSGSLAVDFGGVLQGSKSFTDYYPGIYSASDKTIAMIVSYNSNADVLTFSAPNQTAPYTTGVLGTTFQTIWGLKYAHLLFQHDGFSSNFHYKGKFYEAVFYNYDLFDAGSTDIHANKTRNPNQYQGQEIMNSLGDKYGITP